MLILTISFCESKSVVASFHFGASELCCNICFISDWCFLLNDLKHFLFETF